MGTTETGKPFPWKGVGIASALLATGLGGFFLGRRNETAPQQPKEDSPAEVVKAVEKPVKEETAPKQATAEKTEKPDAGAQKKKEKKEVATEKKPEAGEEVEVRVERGAGGRKVFRITEELTIEGRTTDSSYLIKTVPELMAALKDGDKDVRLNAAWALEKIKDRQAVPTLIEALEGDKEDQVRSWAADALGEIGDSSARPALEAALRDEDFGVRMYAAQALGKIGDKSARPALEAALRDENKNVRSSAAEALEKLETE